MPPKTDASERGDRRKLKRTRGGRASTRHGRHKSVRQTMAGRGNRLRISVAAKPRLDRRSEHDRLAATLVRGAGQADRTRDERDVFDAFFGGVDFVELVRANRRNGEQECPEQCEQPTLQSRADRPAGLSQNALAGEVRHRLRKIVEWTVAVNRRLDGKRPWGRRKPSRFDCTHKIGRGSSENSANSGQIGRFVPILRTGGATCVLAVLFAPGNAG
jgi:hypothetical protein